MKLVPAGSKLLVEQITEKKSDGGGFIVVDDAKPFYAKGKVLANDLELLFGDAVGKVVVYPAECGMPLGLGFPKDMVMVDVEDVHGFIEEEE